MLPARSGCAIEDHVIAGNVEEFRKDFISRIWLTYREEFPQIEASALTTDCGGLHAADRPDAAGSGTHTPFSR